MWVFAVLAVAAMVGAAAVAAGHGTPLAREHGDRPDSGLPAQGPLTADDLRRVRFPLVLRGYRPADVDALLARLAAERDGLDLYRPATSSVAGPVAGPVAAPAAPPADDDDPPRAAH